MILAWTDFSGYFRQQNLRLALLGAAAAALTVVVLRKWPGRATSGWLIGAVANLLGLYMTNWHRWPDPVAWRLIAAVVIAALAGLGYEKLRLASSVRPWVPALVLLTCCGGVWLAVPENSPVIVVAGVIIGLLLSGQLYAPAVGYALTAAAAWSVLVGARSTGYSFDGGLLSFAPLAALPPVHLFRHRRRLRLPPWPWLVVGSSGVAFAAARWVGVAPDATWPRIAVVAAAALVVARVAGPVR